MSDGTKKQKELGKLQEELREAGLSRRSLVKRLSAVGVGFGAAAVLGIHKAFASQGVVDVSSTNPAVNEILAQAKEARPARYAQQRQRYARALHPRSKKK